MEREFTSVLILGLQANENADVRINFLLRFKANYLGKNAWLPPFFFVDSNSPYKDLLLLRGPNLAQKLLQLVGTILN